MTDSIPGDPPLGGQHATTPGWGAAPPPPPPPPPPGSSPRLARSRSDRYIAGVCGGLGAHFHVDPLVFRVGFALLTFAGGIGALLYIGAWLLIPQPGSRQRFGSDMPAGTEHRSTRVIVASLITVLAVVLLADSWQFRHAGLFWGLALVGVGVLLFVREGRQPAWGFNQAPVSDPPMQYAAGAFAPAAVTSPLPQWASSRPRRPRSILGLVTVATALLAVGVAALLDSAGVVSVSVGTGAAIALIVVGAGLIAGSWFGRSRALIALGILLIPFTAAATLVNEPLSGGTGNVVVAPQSLAEVHGQYHLAAGNLTVDLSQIPFTASRDVSVTVAVGNLTVVVPPLANVDVHAHAGAGHIDLFGATDDGVDIDSPASRSLSPGEGTLHLALSVGLGQVDLVYPSSAPAQGQ